jgi:hypothetical protein
VAPKVVESAVVSCRPIEGTSSYERQVHLVLKGGSFWYYQNQNAPLAVIDARVVNTAQSWTFTSWTIGVGKSREQSTGKTATVTLPSPISSKC